MIAATVQHMIAWSPAWAGAAGFQGWLDTTILKWVSEPAPWMVEFMGRSRDFAQNGASRKASFAVDQNRGREFALPSVQPGLWFGWRPLLVVIRNARMMSSREIIPTNRLPEFSTGKLRAFRFTINCRTRVSGVSGST